MLIFNTGLNYQTAPLAVRSAMAVSDAEAAQLMVQLTGRSGGDESVGDESGCDPAALVRGCVVVNTCNRLEIYFTAADPAALGGVQAALCAFKGTDVNQMRRHFYFYRDDQVIRHLIRVCCGLDSMLLGEDQILGQVKMAHELAMACRAADDHMNVMFRSAVTAAKAIKTSTAMPAAPVSVASLAVHYALEQFEHPRVLLIGATGQTGLAVLKNLCSSDRPVVFATRRHRPDPGSESTPVTYHHPRLTWIDYNERFRYLPEVNTVVSATSSPHYVMTAAECEPHMRAGQPYLFLDLAVPMDIDISIGEKPGVRRIDIDTFRQLSEANNRRRRAQSQAAGRQVSVYVDRFMKWHIFQEKRAAMDGVVRRIDALDGRVPASEVVRRLIYNVREYADPETLARFIACLDRDIQRRYLPAAEQAVEQAVEESTNDRAKNRFN